MANDELTNDPARNDTNRRRPPESSLEIGGVVKRSHREGAVRVIDEIDLREVSYVDPADHQALAAILQREKAAKREILLAFGLTLEQLGGSLTISRADLERVRVSDLTRVVTHENPDGSVTISVVGMEFA